MAEDRKSIVSVGCGNIGFPGALFITFLVLKLTHVIDWSWWWISAPLWIPFGIGVVCVIAAFVCYIIVESGRSRTRW